MEKQVMMLTETTKAAAERAIDNFGRSNLTWLKKNSEGVFEQSVVDLADTVQADLNISENEWSLLVDYFIETL